MAARDGSWRSWIIPLGAVLAGGAYTFLPGAAGLFGPEPDLLTLTPPASRQEWVALNKKALQETLRGENEGVKALAKMLEWNRTKKFGVDLRGVELDEVFKAAAGPAGEDNLFDYLRLGGAERLSRFISLRHCDITGAKHPGVPLRGLDMSDARMDAETISRWAKALGGRGLMGANLSGVSLYGMDLSGCNLGGANLSHTAVDVKPDPRVPGKFNATQLMGIDLVGQDLRGLSLKRCDLRMTSIKSGQLADVARAQGGGGLRGAILPSVGMMFEDMRGVGLQFADLRLASVGQRQLGQVRQNLGGTGLYGTKLNEPK